MCAGSRERVVLQTLHTYRGLTLTLGWFLYSSHTPLCSSQNQSASVFAQVDAGQTLLSLWCSVSQRWSHPSQKQTPIDVAHLFDSYHRWKVSKRMINTLRLNNYLQLTQEQESNTELSPISKWFVLGIGMVTRWLGIRAADTNKLPRNISQFKLNP